MDIRKRVGELLREYLRRPQKSRCGGIIVACYDNLTGLCEAINSIFSKIRNQLCIALQIRNSYKFVP